MMTRPASETEDQTLTVLKIGEARENFPQMVSSLESGSSATYVVGRYGKPAAALVSYQRFAPMLAHGHKKEKLALLIVEDLLGDAPQHIRSPAIVEVSRLPMSDLMALWRLDALPDTDRAAAATRKKLRHPEVLDRLLQRARIARAIADARAAGLYELAEDAAGAGSSWSTDPGVSWPSPASRRRTVGSSSD
jgi:hypothetical protein